MKKEEKIKLSNTFIRRKYWFINGCINNLLRFVSKNREKNIWIFGCWGGNRYEDNSRYLFEYVCKYHKEISAFWFTGNDNIFSKLSSVGANVINIKSEEAISVMKKAGVVFYTNGLDDFGGRVYLYGSILINLTHSISGVKKDGYLDHRFENNKLRFYCSKLKHIFFNWEEFNYTTVSSEQAMRWRMGVNADYNRSKYWITGLPRNDLLRNSDIANMSFPKYISFLPTYRPYSNDVVNTFIKGITSNKELMLKLEESNISILIKLHNADETSQLFQHNNPRVKLIDDSDFNSMQEFLLGAMAVITDYSSVCMDYSLTGKPILIYAPDFEKYDLIHGVVNEWKELYQSKHNITSLEELINTIIILINNGFQSNELTQIIAEFSEDISIHNSLYCQNVYEKVIFALERCK